MLVLQKTKGKIPSALRMSDLATKTLNNICVIEQY